MRHLIAAFVLSLPCLAATPARAAEPASSDAPKVLLVVSSEGRDGGKTRPGFDVDEFAQAWLALRDNGVVADVASPAGGAVDLGGFNPEDDHIVALMADATAKARLGATRRTADIAAGEHEAILVIGGKGAMLDLPKDEALARLLSDHDARGGVVAAVCHGPAAFAHATRADGTPLVAGRRMTGFTDEEESVFGKEWVKQFPFLLETELRRQGARWEEAALMMPKVVVDGRWVTGQNPFATPAVAEAVLRALGRTPGPRTVYREEATMRLVTRWLDGEREAVRAELARDVARHKVELIAMLGYYQFEAARDDTVRRQALSIMELAAPHFAHPQLRFGMARAHAALDAPERARELLAEVLREEPDHAEARTLQDRLAAER
jgi:putative intracellular protease/amidase